MLRRFLSFLCCFVFVSWLLLNRYDDVAQSPAFSLIVDLNNTVPAQRLTAVLPISISQPSTLADALIPFLAPSKLLEVVILVPESRITATRAIVREFVSLLEDLPHPDFSIRVWPNHLTQSVAVLRTSSQVSSNWVLVLDDTGLTKVGANTRNLLLNPPALDTPLGPRGMHRSTCLTPTVDPQPATYLVPPFVLPTSLADPPSSDSDLWLNLGLHVANSTGHGCGGFVISFDLEEDTILSSHTCHHDFGLSESTANSDIDTYNPYHLLPTSTEPLFVILFSLLSDLQEFASVPCKLRDQGIFIFAILYAPSVTSDGQVSHGSCALRYKTVAEPHSYLAYLRRGLNRDVDVVISSGDLKPRDSHIPWISIPASDLPFTSWMGSLTLAEWQNWDQPRLDISIVTKDRPRSLTRLLGSLSKARFYGDTLHLRINMEQSADEQTMRVVQDFKWEHGNTFLHHRVIHGGLLPAVVESWYPGDNNTYGLLLEDDVELSPLFYAWIKMTLLRYRYGADAEQSSRLFGISLYQQQFIELHPTGRRPFAARPLFESLHIHPSSPYLSQIPCSWGAVYFPEYWRLFHTYLTLRFSQTTVPIGTFVVPDVRSNRWTKSWKRYFIEMVYLQGLVMLYPNFEQFVSLSTNHLEVGAHVMTQDVEKQRLFRLPLMKDEEHTMLLDLPGESLPLWGALPVLNLTGDILSLTEIKRIGWVRSAELSQCAEDELRSEIYERQRLLHICGDSGIVHDVL